MKELLKARLLVRGIVFILMLIGSSISVVDALADPRESFRETDGISELKQLGSLSNAKPGAALGTAPASLSEDLQGQSSGLDSFPEEISNLYQQVNPAVVSLQAVFMAPDKQIDDPTDIQFTVGTGFVYDGLGHIITSADIVKNADFVRVRYSDGKTTIAEVVGTDIPSNLAVLSVPEMPEQRRPLRLADSSDIQTGEMAAAVGNPYGQRTTLTLGAVSTAGRVIPAGLGGFNILLSIQTNSPNNPGNFGGPLLNMAGEVIGVNTRLKSADSRTNPGISFAIPVNVIKLVVPGILEHGEYSWPWLGVSISPFTISQSREMDLEYQSGAYIDQLAQEGPAAQAGLQGTSEVLQNGGLSIPVGGDVVIQANGNPLNDTSDLLAEIAYSQPGETIKLTILRDGEQIQIEALLEPFPEGDLSGSVQYRSPAPLNPMSGQRTPGEFEGIDLPDLQAMLPTDLRIDKETGNKQLRFSITFVNSGYGPMELRSQTDQSSGDFSVQQYLFGQDQMMVVDLEGAFTYSQSHGHTHWENFALYEIWTVTPAGELDQVMVAEDKVGFCLLDLDTVSGVWLSKNVRYELDILENPEYTGCGNTRQGISAGWVDTYESHLAGQALDIEGLNNGVYALRSTLDPVSVFHEADSENNSAVIYFVLHDNEICVMGEEFSLLNLCDLPSR